MKRITLLFGALSLPLSSLLAVEVQSPSQAVVEVKGIVCSFCAYGARKNLSKVDFLDRKQFKDGLLMETEKGAITMALEKGKPVDFTQVHRAIKKGGYEVLAIHLRLAGILEKRQEAVVLKNKFNGQEFFLVDENGTPWDAGEYAGKDVTIQGVIPETVLSKAKSADIPVQVKAIQ